MLYIMADTGWREGICWSVWSPRSSFLERTSPRLKAFNHLFSDLGAPRAFIPTLRVLHLKCCACRSALVRTLANRCPADVPNPGNRCLGDLVPQANVLTYLSEEARADCFASRLAVQRANDAFYLGQLDQSHGVVTHVSRIGRLNYSVVRQVCMRINGALHEIISAEVVLPANSRPLVDYGPYHAALPPAPPLAITHATTARDRADLEIEWVLETPAEVRSKDSRRKRLPDNFCCTLCGATSTPEARYASRMSAEL